MNKRLVFLLLLAIGFFAITGTLWHHQRQELQHWRTLAAQQTAPATTHASVLTAVERSISIDSLVDPTTLTKSQRRQFLRLMQTCVAIHDSGMTTFTPHLDYREKVRHLNADAILALIHDLSAANSEWSEERSIMKSTLLSRLVKLDPLRALHFVYDPSITDEDDQRMEAASNRWSHILKSGIAELSKTDPDAARHWLDQAQWHDDEFKWMLHAIHAHSIASQDMAQALAVIDTFPHDANYFPRALSMVAGVAASESDRGLIKDYLKQLDDAQVQAKAQASLVDGLLHREGFDPAARALEAAFEKGNPQYNQALLNLATQAFQEAGPAKVAEWLLTKSSETHRIENLRHYVGQWISQDYNAAAKWLGDIPNNVERDAAIEVLIENVRPFDPDGAEAWGLLLKPQPR